MCYNYTQDIQTGLRTVLRWNAVYQIQLLLLNIFDASVL